MDMGAVVMVPGGEGLMALQGPQPHNRATRENLQPRYSSRKPIFCSYGWSVCASWECEICGLLPLRAMEAKPVLPWLPLPDRESSDFS